jgi:hypothetical protein
MYGKIVIISKKFFRVAEKLQVRYISKEGNMFADGRACTAAIDKYYY